MLKRDDLCRRGYEWYARQGNIDMGDQSRCPGPNLAIANLIGSPCYPNIRGKVFFQAVGNGTAVLAIVNGLPPYQPGTAEGSPIGPHGFHIHQFGNCEIGDPNNPFLAAGGHWNPDNQPHGNHAGDFPVLFSNHGVAVMGFFTDRFRPRDVIGRSVLIHENPDDYRTQPSGNSGEKIACGAIMEL